MICQAMKGEIEKISDSSKFKLSKEKQTLSIRLNFKKKKQDNSHSTQSLQIKNSIFLGGRAFRDAATHIFNRSLLNIPEIVQRQTSTIHKRA